MGKTIFWALGIAASVSFTAVTGPSRIAASLGLSKPGAPPSAAALTPVVPGQGRTHTLNADLRGHYTAHAMVNGTVIRTIVDTGATVVALTDQDARAVGAHKAQVLRTAQFSTANGVVSGKIVRLAEIRVGDIVVRDVEAAVMPGGALSVTLLGMSFLRGLRGFEISGGRLVMKG